MCFRKREGSRRLCCSASVSVMAIFHQLVKPGRATPSRWAGLRLRTPSVLLGAAQALNRKMKHEPKEGASVLHRLWERYRQRLAALSKLQLPPSKDNRPCESRESSAGDHCLRDYHPSATGWLPS